MLITITKKERYNIIYLSLLYLLLLIFLRLPFWQNIDTHLALFIIEQRTPMFTNFFYFFTRFADGITIVGLLILLTIFFTIKKNKIVVFRFITASSSCFALTSMIKLLVNRNRPPFSQLLHETSKSFPSGHSSASMIFYGNLALYLLSIVQNRFWHLIIILVNASLILIIGFSRLYLGVHWFSDILSGYLTGIFVLTIIHLLKIET